MTKHLPSDKMIRALKFMGAAFRDGRPSVAPMRKEHEHILGEELDWQLAETARNELDNQEVEMRLMAEYGDNEEIEREELMIISEVLCYSSSVWLHVDQSNMRMQQTERGTTLCATMPE